MKRMTDDVYVSLRVVSTHSYHWHEDLTLIRVIAGSILLRVSAKDNLMKAGDILVLNRGEMHSLKALEEENLVLIITFKHRLCLQSVADFGESFILCNSAAYGQNNPQLYEELQKQVQGLICAYGQEEERAKVRERATAIVAYLSHHFDYVASGRTHKRFSDYIIRRNKMFYRNIFVDESPMAEMTLKEIAETQKVSYTYLRTDIIERFGCGFNWMKNRQRVEKAAKMLLTTDKRLIDISNQCGFSDPKYFRKYFQIFFETSPSDFRRQIQAMNIKDSYAEIPLKYVIHFNHFKESEKY